MFFIRQDIEWDQTCGIFIEAKTVPSARVKFQVFLFSYATVLSSLTCIDRTLG